MTIFTNFPCWRSNFKIVLRVSTLAFWNLMKPSHSFLNFRLQNNASKVGICLRVPRTFGQDNCKYLKFLKFLATYNILKNAESWHHLFSRSLVEMWTVTHQFITHFTHASMPSTFDSIPRLGMVTSAWELSCMDAMVRDEKKWKLRRQKIKGSFLFSKGQCHERSSKFSCKLC